MPKINYVEAYYMVNCFIFVNLFIFTSRPIYKYKFPFPYFYLFLMIPSETYLQYKTQMPISESPFTCNSIKLLKFTKYMLT